MRSEIHLWWEEPKNIWICWTAHRCSLWRSIHRDLIGAASLISFAGDTCTWWCWAFVMLHIRVIHSVQIDVLTSTKRAASFCQFPSAWWCSGGAGESDSVSTQRLLSKANENFRGTMAVQHGQKNRISFVAVISKHTLHTDTLYLCHAEFL